MTLKRNKPLICFDLGDVLVELGPAIRSFVRPDCRPRLTSLLEHYGLGKLSTPVFFERLQGLMLEPVSLSALQEIFVQARLRGLRDGSETLIDELVMNEVDLAVLSNINEAHWQHLRQFDIFHEFQHHFLSFQLGAKKPNNDIYEMVEFATMRAGRDIFFFDDREENVSSARALGWNAYQVPADNAVASMRKTLVGLGLL